MEAVREMLLFCALIGETDIIESGDDLASDMIGFALGQ
jgi:hypothetical protein